MAIIVKHSFVSPKLDGPDPTVVRPSNWNDEHDLTGDGWMIAGMVIDYIGHTLPAYLLECYGQSVSAATYDALFAAMVKQATVTLTLGTPGVVNWANHGLIVGSKVRFRTTGALPTGLVANTDYFVLATGFTTAAFRVSATAGGAAIDFSGSQSGVHTGVNAQYGVSNDLTTFTVPDLRGRVTAGLDSMGGTAAGRLTSGVSGVNGALMGAVGGLESHTLTTAQIAAHTHNNNPPAPTIDFSGLVVTINSGGAHTHSVTGTVDSAGAHSHTVTGSVDSGGAHTHTVTGTVAAAGGHTHGTSLTISGSSIAPAGGHTHADTFSFTSGVTNTAAAHTHPDTFAAATTVNSTNSAHTHVIGDLEFIAREALDGGRTIVQSTAETGGSGTPVTNLDGLHSHTATTSISGSVSSGGAHSHTVTGTISGSITAVADHTHTLTGGTIGGSIDAVGDHSHSFTSGAAASAGAHTHTFSSGAAASAGAHTHTFSSGVAASGGAHTHTSTPSGTITSALADFLTDAAGGGGAHNNVQPTFIVRKVLYVG